MSVFFLALWSEPFLRAVGLSVTLELVGCLLRWGFWCSSWPLSCLLPLWLCLFTLLLHSSFIKPPDIVAFVVDPSGTICSSVFWLPTTRLSGALSLYSRRIARRPEPSKEEALPGAKGCQRATRCGMILKLSAVSQRDFLLLAAWEQSSGIG